MMQMQPRDRALMGLTTGARAYAERMATQPPDKKEIDRLSAEAPALDVAVVDAVASAILQTEEEKDGEIDPMKAAYEARIVKLGHDVDYWKGINDAALRNLREQAALIADADQHPVTAAKIRGLRIVW